MFENLWLRLFMWVGKIMFLRIKERWYSAIKKNIQNHVVVSAPTMRVVEGGDVPLIEITHTVENHSVASFTLGDSSGLVVRIDNVVVGSLNSCIRKVTGPGGIEFDTESNARAAISYVLTPETLFWFNGQSKMVLRIIRGALTLSGAFGVTSVPIPHGPTQLQGYESGRNRIPERVLLELRKSLGLDASS